MRRRREQTARGAGEYVSQTSLLEIVAGERAFSSVIISLEVPAGSGNKEQAGSAREGALLRIDRWTGTRNQGREFVQRVERRTEPKRAVLLAAARELGHGEQREGNESVQKRNGLDEGDAKHREASTKVGRQVRQKTRVVTWGGGEGCVEAKCGERRGVICGLVRRPRGIWQRHTL